MFYNNTFQVGICINIYIGIFKLIYTYLYFYYYELVPQNINRLYSKNINNFLPDFFII